MCSTPNKSTVSNLLPTHSRSVSIEMGYLVSPPTVLGYLPPEMVYWGTFHRTETRTRESENHRLTTYHLVRSDHLIVIVK